MITKKDNSKKTPVVSQIVIKQPVRKTHDIAEWRTALRGADMGRVKQLYDLFDDLLIDGVLSDAIDKRIGAVCNSAITFQNAKGEEVPEIVELIDTHDFEELLTAIMMTRFYGRSGGEFSFANGFGFTPLPPKHVGLESRSILINDNDAAGIPYEEDDHLLVTGKPRNYGLLLKAAPMVIYKRGGFGDYAQWLELFGMPRRIGKYSSYDPQSRQLLEEALEKAGSAPYAVIPKETDVETINESGGSNGGTGYNDFRKACNEEMLITILGQTMTTLDGSSRSQGEVHKEVEEGKNRSDMRYVRRMLNQVVLPLLEKRGYPVKGGWFLFPEDSEPLTVAEIVQLSSIIDIPSFYIHEKYSIPQPRDGEPIAGKLAKPEPEPEPEPEPGAGEGGGEEKGKDGKTVPPEKIENADRSLFSRLLGFFVAAPGSGAKHTGTLTLDDLDLNGRIAARVARGGAKFDAELFSFTSNKLISALDVKPVRLVDLGFVYGYQNDAFRTAQEINVFRFSAGKTLAEIQALNELYKNVTTQEDFLFFAKGLTKEYNETYLRTEYQTATLVSESAATYNRLAGKTDLFPIWQYKTVGDDKVRDSHRLLDGIMLEADDPRWDKIFTPNGWRCRCRVVPKMRHEAEGHDFEGSRALVDAFLESPEFGKAAEQGFGVNRGKSPEIYTDAQGYITNFDTNAGAVLQTLDYKYYGLQPVEKLAAAAKGVFSPYKGTANDFAGTLRNENGKALLADHAGRSMVFDASKIKGSPDLLNAMREATSAPDEVWLNSAGGKSLDKYVMIRYYNGTAVAVVSQIAAGTVYRISEVLRLTGKGLRWGLRIK